MTHAKSYVLVQKQTDEWGRTRNVYFRRKDPHHFEKVSRITEATHFRDEERAEEVLSVYTEFDAWTPTHVPLLLYPESIANPIRNALNLTAEA